MLLAFRVSNYRSILDEQELSLVRASRHSDEGGTLGASPVAAIYGANASGKSNVFAALKFMREAVLDSHSDWDDESGIPVEPFLLDQVSASSPSRFEIDFSWLDVRYRYGFEVSRSEVLSEWLYAYPKGRRQTLFERDSTATNQYYFGKNLIGRNRVISELTRSNALFLSTAAASRHDRLTKLVHWFRSHLRTADAADETNRMIFTAKEIMENAASANAIAGLLRSADLGICDIVVDKREPAGPDLPEGHSSDQSSRVRRRRRPVPGLNTGQFVIQFKHRCHSNSDPVPLPLEAESLGTRSLLSLAGPIMFVLRTQTVLLVDEIDRSLHPRLVAEIIQLFRDPEINTKGSQLVFTSHDTSFLGGLISESPLLDRDQVWFTEKDGRGATNLYPLTDFSPRRLENLERGYLQGRYGGVPVLGPLAATPSDRAQDIEVAEHSNEQA